MHYIMVTHQEVPEASRSTSQVRRVGGKVAKQNNVKESRKELVVLQRTASLFIVEDTGRALVRGPNGHFLPTICRLMPKLMKAIPELKAESLN